MRRIIVLEGPDFAGKSTLAARLQTNAAVAIRTNGPPPAGDLAQHYADQIAQARRSLSSTVFDRLHVGELIYGPEFRGTSRLTDEDLRALETMLDEAGAIRVHVDASDETLLRRFRGPRGDPLIDDEQRLLRIAASYRRLLDGRPGWTTWQSDLDGSPPVALAIG